MRGALNLNEYEKFVLERAKNGENIEALDVDRLSDDFFGNMDCVLALLSLCNDVEVRGLPVIGSGCTERFISVSGKGRLIGPVIERLPEGFLEDENFLFEVTKMNPLGVVDIPDS